MKCLCNDYAKVIVKDYSDDLTVINICNSSWIVG